MALTFDRFFDWDFHISISATQGHTRVPEQVSEISLGERLSIERCRKLGMIFHATDNANYESIREQGLVLEATRASWQKHRLAVHFVYAGGVTSPGLGTVVKYGPYVFIAISTTRTTSITATSCILQTMAWFWHIRVLRPCI